jgi:hypothetical protein
MLRKFLERDPRSPFDRAKMIRDQGVEQMLDFLELYGSLTRGEDLEDYV